jgi:hypothetical protein
MQTLEQRNDWVAWIEHLEQGEKSSNGAITPAHSNEAHVDSWAETDRQLHVRVAQPTPASVGYGSSTQSGDGHSARTRWLQEHNVHTEFLDAGIGCCWFAQLGDDEPVCGETEDAAITRLARENGLSWG